MKPELKRKARRHLVSVLAVLAGGVVLGMAGMDPAAAAGVAGISVAAVEGSGRWRAGRCARRRS